MQLEKTHMFTTFGIRKTTKDFQCKYGNAPQQSLHGVSWARHSTITLAVPVKVNLKRPELCFTGSKYPGLQIPNLFAFMKNTSRELECPSKGRTKGAHHTDGKCVHEDHEVRCPI